GRAEVDVRGVGRRDPLLPPSHERQNPPAQDPVLRSARVDELKTTYGVVRLRDVVRSTGHRRRPAAPNAGAAAARDSKRAGAGAAKSLVGDPHPAAPGALR